MKWKGGEPGRLDNRLAIAASLVDGSHRKHEPREVDTCAVSRVSFGDSRLLRLLRLIKAREALQPIVVKRMRTVQGNALDSLIEHKERRKQVWTCVSSSISLTETPRFQAYWHARFASKQWKKGARKTAYRRWRRLTNVAQSSLYVPRMTREALEFMHDINARRRVWRVWRGIVEHHMLQASQWTRTQLAIHIRRHEARAPPAAHLFVCSSALLQQYQLLLLRRRSCYHCELIICM